MGYAVVWLVNTLVGAYIWVIIASAILSWLVVFNVVNVRNRFVYQLGRFLDAITEPVLRPIRRIIPLIGGIDLSPIVLIFGLQFLLILFNRTLAPILVGALG
ncbi:MAG TPA: YggT family protein [Caulobacteraceae bacterium]|jgi:YggT family protein